MQTMALRPCNRRGDSLAVAFTRTLFGIFVAIVIALISAGAHAQSPQDLAHPTPPPTPDANADFADPYATAGPKIYVTDAAGRLATVTLGTYAVHIIGSEGVVLTDIGFNPKDGQLYGVSFTSFYRVNPTTGKATLIGSLGISDANALVFNGQGVAYTAGVNESELYTINVKTGRVKPIGSISIDGVPIKSAGDLTFFNSGLVLSGYYQSSVTNSPDTLVLLNPKNGEALAYSELKISNLFGIVCPGKDLLFGFAGTSVYELFPAQANIAKRAVLLRNLAGKGLSQIYGAAYDGYFLY